MFNAFTMKFNTVVMDGTQTEIVNFIMNDLIDELNNREYGKSICRPLDDRHPTMIVIETHTTERKYKTMQDLIELCYPGQCIFNPPM